MIYCRICQCDYKVEELITWTGGDSLQLLCPGCDDILISPICEKCRQSATYQIVEKGKLYYFCDEHSLKV